MAFPEFVVLAVNWAYQQWVCKFLFLIRTLVKTNSNLMYDSDVKVIARTTEA